MSEVIDRVAQPGVVVVFQVPQVVVGINDLQHAVTPVVRPMRPKLRPSEHAVLRNDWQFPPRNISGKA